MLAEHGPSLDLVGEHGSTPREWRASFLSRRSLQEARARVLAWM